MVYVKESYFSPISLTWILFFFTLLVNFDRFPLSFLLGDLKLPFTSFLFLWWL